MNRIIIIVVSLFVLTILGLLFLNRTKNQEQKTSVSPTPTQEKEVDIKASFLIFTNGTKRDFSDPRYHHRTEEIFVDPSSPTTINVKAEHATWFDFFQTLPMKLEDSCLTTGTGQTYCSGQEGTLKFFINGHLVPDLLDREIQDGDRLLISFGPGNDPAITSQMNQVPQP